MPEASAHLSPDQRSELRDRGPIALQRLEVLPETPFCIDCRERFERES